VGKSPQLKPLKNDIEADLVIKSTLLSSKQTAQVYTMMSGEKTRDFIARYLGVYEKTLRKYKTVTYTGIADLVHAVDKSPDLIDAAVKIVTQSTSKNKQHQYLNELLKKSTGSNNNILTNL